MNNIIILIYLIFILTLNFSCIERKLTEKEVAQSQLVNKSTKDSIKFTSGINAIFQDSKGNFWYGSRQEGVAVFDGQSSKYFTTDEGLPNNQIRSIKEDSSGKIWIETSNGICSYDGVSITNHTVNENIALQNNWAKASNDLWFGAGRKEGVYRYDGQKLYYLAFPNPPVINPNNLYSVTCMSQGKNDRLWIGTYAGVFGYNGNEFTIINDASLGLDIDSEPLHIRSILEDSKGRLWIGNNGIGVLLKENDSMINFSEVNKLIHPSSKRKGDKSLPGTLEHIFAIEEDGAGNIWFSDRDTGIWKYDGTSIKNYTDLMGQENQFAHTIYKDNMDELWFILTNGSVFKFNGKSFDSQF